MLRRISAGLFAPLLGISTAYAGGAGLYEMGTPDLGTATAGRAALAMDASTAWGNPGGMVLLDGTQLMVGFQPSYFSVEFDPSQATTVDGNNGGNAGGFAPILSAHVTHRLGETTALGLSLASGLASGLEYDFGWVGRYYVERTELVTFTVNPSFAFRMAEWISVGVGVDLVFGSFDQASAVNNRLDPTWDDGQILFQDRATGLGANLGILLEAENGARIGFTYRSPVTLGFEDLVSTTGIGPNLQAILDLRGTDDIAVDAAMTLPQDVMLSVYQPLGDAAAVMFNSGWQRWEEFGKTDITVSDTTSVEFTADRILDDTWHFAVGFHVEASPDWLVMAGFAYDTEASPDRHRTLDFPVDRQFRYSAGAKWEMDDRTALSGAYQFADFGPAKVSQERVLPGTVVGDYSSNNGHYFGLSMNRTW